MSSPLLVIQAETPYTPGSPFVPAFRYFHQHSGWGPYDQATQYPIPGPLPLPEGPRENSVVDTILALPVDLNGGPYYIMGGIAYRVTPCCAAAATYIEGELNCKSCYEEVDDTCGGLARLDGTWEPPERIVLWLPDPQD